LVRAYAEALVNVLGQDGQVEPGLDELDELVTATAGSPAFRVLVESPAVSRAERDRILVQLFESQARPTLLKFLRVLNRAGRLDQLAAVARQARKIWNARQNRKVVRIRSAVPLDAAQQQALRDRLGTTLRCEPILELTVDPTVLGGLVIQVGDVVYDSSVRSQLARLRRQLVEDKVQQIRGQLVTRALGD
jgi:F-type H+-transporting ATPase subunit delta